jgi:hypothetical protein
MLPLVPLLCLTAALWLERVTQRWRGKWVILLAVLLSVPSACAVWQHNSLLVREDTRLLAANWLETHLPGGTRIAMHGSEYGYPQLRRNRSWLRERLEDVRKAGLPGERLARMLQLTDYPLEPSYYVVELRPPDLSYMRSVWPYYTTAQLAREGIHWIVTHEHPLPYSRVDEDFQLQLEQDAVLVKSFSPFENGTENIVYDPLDAYYVPLAGFDRVERPGPSIRIYRLREAGF